MVHANKNCTSPKGRTRRNHESRGHPLSRESLTGLVATNLADLEHMVLEQAPRLITDLCPRARTLYGQGNGMGLLLAQGGVRMR